MIENVNIVLSDEADFAATCIGLEQAGLTVRARLPDIGAVVGSVDADRLADLRQVSGVLAVERESTVHTQPTDPTP